MKPSSSSCARMLRTVADETVTPDALTRSDEGTGSPSAMYSRTKAARIRLDRSEGSISTRELRLLGNYTLQPAKLVVVRTFRSSTWRRVITDLRAARGLAPPDEPPR